jgi:hypothetical protein
MSARKPAGGGGQRGKDRELAAAPAAKLARSPARLLVSSREAPRADPGRAPERAWPSGRFHRAGIAISPRLGELLLVEPSALPLVEPRHDPEPAELLLVSSRGWRVAPGRAPELTLVEPREDLAPAGDPPSGDCHQPEARRAALGQARRARAWTSCSGRDRAPRPDAATQERSPPHAHGPRPGRAPLNDPEPAELLLVSELGGRRAAPGRACFWSSAASRGRTRRTALGRDRAPRLDSAAQGALTCPWSSAQPDLSRQRCSRCRVGGRRAATWSSPY